WPFARIHDFCWVNRGVVYLLFQDSSIFADQEIYPACSFVLVNVNTVFTGGLASPIAQQREGHSNRISERFVGKRAIHAHTQDLGVGSFQLLQILLEVFHLLRSTTGKGKNIKGQHNLLLAAILTERDLFEVMAVEIGHLKVWGEVSDFRHWSSSIILTPGEGRQKRRAEQHHRKNVSFHCGLPVDRV